MPDLQFMRLPIQREKTRRITNRNLTQEILKLNLKTEVLKSILQIIFHSTKICKN